jgi:hypothetical protein
VNIGTMKIAILLFYVLTLVTLHQASAGKYEDDHDDNDDVDDEDDDNIRLLRQ